MKNKLTVTRGEGREGYRGKKGRSLVKEPVERTHGNGKQDVD